MAGKKIFTTLEKEHGIMFIGDVDLKQKMTDEDFIKLMHTNEGAWRGVDHTVRTKFLKDNDHEVTRENMLNVELSAKPLEESEE